MSTATFNGADLLLLAVVLLAAALAAYAARRAHREREAPEPAPEAAQDWPELAADLDAVRAVRASFDGLPYRHARRRQGAEW